MHRFSAIPAIIALAWAVSGSAEAQSSTVKTEVMQVDDAYRLAKLKQDLPALNRILADGFNPAIHFVDGHNRRLVDDDALAAGVDAGVGRAQVDGQVTGEHRKHRTKAQKRLLVRVVAKV